jgi:hypothetical protein
MIRFFAPSLLNELFDDFKLIAVFMLWSISTNQDENYYSFLTGYVRSFYKGGFADLY